MVTDPDAGALRSILFVSGASLQSLPDALSSKADGICIDLEDAVPPRGKSEARKNVSEALTELTDSDRRRIFVRINSLRSLEGVTDVLALLSTDHAPAALLLPKVETDDEVRWAACLAADAGSDVRLACIIETTSGLEHCSSIAAADSRLCALFFGAFDLSTALGAKMAWEPLLYARSRVVQAAAGAGLQILDSPFPDIDDALGLRKSAAQAKDLGMTGKTAKKASQIEAINAAFSLSPSELVDAQKIVNAFQLNPTAPLVIDGKLIELPTIKRLRRILGQPAFPA